MLTNMNILHVLVNTVGCSALICFCLSAAPASDARGARTGATYYVNAGIGSDSSDGLSPNSAWRTIERVNSAALKPGDRVLFNRGGVWRGQLRPVSGNEAGRITYGAYGRGFKPRIFGSAERDTESDWQDQGGHVWRSDGFSIDVGNIIFNGGKAVGIKVWKREDVNSPLRYWYDKEHSALFLHCEQNPAKLYSSIECALTRHIIDESNRSWVTYTDLDFRYGGAHGIGGIGTSHIIVRNCDLSYIGGGHQFTDKNGHPVRYGNGIEFWDSAHDNLVEGCRLWEIYDAALTNQGFDKNSQTDITYRNNIIWNSEYSFEYWNRPGDSITRNIHFENNTCVNAGHGWSHAQRPDPTGRHLMFYENSAKTSSFFVTGNIFYQTQVDSQVCLDLRNDWSKDLTMDNNCLYQAAGSMINWGSDRFTMAQMQEYQSKTGEDRHSVVDDPHFADIARHDYRPAAGSSVCKLAVKGGHAGALPCIGEGE